MKLITGFLLITKIALFADFLTIKSSSRARKVVLSAMGLKGGLEVLGGTQILVLYHARPEKM